MFFNELNMQLNFAQINSENSILINKNNSGDFTVLLLDFASLRGLVGCTF